MNKNKKEWPKVTKENYFSNEMNLFYMGSTQFKKFIPAFGGCEAAAMAEVKGDYVPNKSEAFTQGSYGHAWNEGAEASANFKAEHPEMFSSRGATKGELKATFKKIGDAIEALENDPLCMKALEGEKEKIFTAEIFGMPWKIAIDNYKPEERRFSDLKFLKELHGKIWNVELQCYENVFEAYGYYLQVALYAEGERKHNDREDYFEPLLVIATKEAKPDKCIMSFASEAESYSDFISKQLAIASQYAPRVKAVKYEGATPIRCEKCDYCRSTKKLTGTTHYSAFDIY